MASIVIESANPWRHLNEYEGAITIRLEGTELVGRAVLASAAGWDALISAPRVPRQARVWLERTGDVGQLTTSAPPSLLRHRDTIYELVGQVVSVDEDQLVVAGPVSLQVDLDTAPSQRRPALRSGDTVRVVGELRIELSEE